MHIQALTPQWVLAGMFLVGSSYAQSTPSTEHETTEQAATGATPVEPPASPASDETSSQVESSLSESPSAPQGTPEKTVKAPDPVPVVTPSLVRHKREAQPTKYEAPRPLRLRHWMLELGLRNSLVSSAGYDPYASNDIVAQFSLGLHREVVRMNPLRFSAGLRLDSGETHGSARGQDASLAIHDFGFPLMGKYDFSRTLFAAGTLVPQLIHARAQVDDKSSSEALVMRDWRWGLEGTIGVGWAPLARGATGPLEDAWLRLDLGYAWTGTKDATLQPDVDEDDPRASDRLQFPSLNFDGPVLRLGVGLSF